MKSVAAGCIAAALVAACGPPQTPAGLATSVKSAADLHCSLPIVTPNHIGFVDFPSGKYRADPTAPTADRNWLFYAKGANKWITIFWGFGSQLISPDGESYLRSDAGPIASGPNGPGTQGYTDVYAVSIATQAERKIGRIPGAGGAVAWKPDGVYVLTFPNRVARLDPSTGKSVELGPKGPDAARANPGLWFWFTSSAAWNSLIAGPNQGDKNSIVEMSLKDGSTTTWLTAPAGRSVSIFGFVGPEEPLVVEYNTEPYQEMTGVSFMQLTAPGTASALKFDPSINSWFGGFTDSMGVWLGSPGHLWLYDRAGMLPAVDLQTWIGSELPRVAGPCR